MVQWLRLNASTTWSMGSIPGQGTKIPHDRGSAKIKKKKRGNFHIGYSLNITYVSKL